LIKPRDSFAFRRFSKYISTMFLRFSTTGLASVLLLAGGCMNEARTYEVSVHNGLDQPVTIWLVKDHGPDEMGWESPEEMGLENPEEDAARGRLPDVIVPPAAVAHCGPVTGQFDKLQGRAYLRVYQGTPTLTQMLAIDRASPSRVDVLLEPGRNRVDVNDQRGTLDARRVEGPTTQP
jgi:hypothetical protein